MIISMITSNIHLAKNDNFASGFYFLSRIIYASNAKILKKKLNYKHTLNQIGLNINSKNFE